MNLKTALQSFRHYKLPRTRALEHELENVRAQHRAVSAHLEQVRDELGRAHDDDVQQIALLQSQLSDIELDRDAARQQVQTLERSLDSVREEFERAHSSDGKQIAALQSQLVQIETDRNHARQQVALLEGALQQATQRQESTEQRLRALETQLEQARGRHESELSLARETLTSLQSEQQGMLAMQSEMTRSFTDASQVLVKSVQSLSRPSLWQLVLLSGLLFLTGTLATVMVLQQTREPPPDLAGVSGRIDDLQLMMQTHFRSHEQLLETLTRLVGGLSDSAAAPRAAPVPEVLEPDDHVQLDVLPGEQVRLVQENLQTLGFDIGPSGVDGIRGAQTGRALGWFRTLYLPDQSEASMQAIETRLQYHADQARADAEKYRLDSAIVAAIHLASLRTGVEFPYLMELAAVESSFDPRAQAGSTTAAGLFQFREDTWLEAIKRHGIRYGLGRYTRAVEYIVDDQGNRQPQIPDPQLQQQVLDLRFNPKLSALLAAERVRYGKRRLAGKLKREPGRADLYLTHFFGMTGALAFLEALAKSPDSLAGEIFPGPARRNRNIFQRSNRTLRTVAEVYRLLERKFNTTRFDDGQG